MYKRTKKDIIADVQIFITEHYFLLTKKEIYKVLRARGYSYPTIEKYYRKYDAQVKKYEEENSKLKSKLEQIDKAIEDFNGA